MHLLLQRHKSFAHATLGSLSLDGSILCFTLEDQIREIPDQPVSSWKIKAQTAIPQGLYKIAWTDSKRFKRKTLQLMNVPGFDGIRIHSGNTDVDTEGCILLGLGMNGSLLTKSKDAVKAIETLLLPHLPEGIEIEVKNPEMDKVS